MIINLDRIEIQFITNNYSINDKSDFIFLEETNKYELYNEFYKTIHYVYYDGNEIGKLYTNPTSKNNTARFKFSKDLIYSKTDLVNLYDLFLKSQIGLIWDQFVYLEICENTLDPYLWNKIFHIYCNRKDANQYEKPLYTQKSKVPITIHSLFDNKEFVIAHKKISKEDIQNEKTNNSKHRIVIYKKTNLTSYMINYYNSKGLSVINHLYRLEVRLLKEFFNDLIKKKEIHLEFADIFKPENQKIIMDEAIRDKIQFYIVASKYNDKNNNKKYKEFISLYTPYTKLKDLNLINKQIPNKSSVKQNKHILFKVDEEKRNSLRAFTFLLKEYANTGNHCHFKSILEIILKRNIMNCEIKINKLILEGYNFNRLTKLKEYLNDDINYRYNYMSF